MRLCQCSVIALLAAALPLQAMAETRIGAMGAANPTIQGTPEAGEARVLMIGGEVVQNELISTSPEGSGQVIFLDQTTLSVAPNSEIVLDRYVYDPDQGAGEIGITLTKGALRFIGGRITKQNAATVRTPTATIGIRGGAVLIGVEGTGETTVIHVAGEWTRIGEGSAEVDLRRTGAKVVTGADGIPRLDGVASQAEIDAFYAQFEGGGGGLRTALRPPAISDDLADLTGFGAGERGGAERLPVATSGASPVLRDVVAEEPGDYQNTIEPPVLSDFPGDDQPPDPDPDPDPEPEFFETEIPLTGVTGVALFTPATDPALLAVSATTFTGRNILLTPDTVDPLAEVFEGETGFIEGSIIEIERVSLNGYRADGERYVVPIDREDSGTLDYFDGESPFVPDPIIEGTSILDGGTDFTSAFYETGATSQVFFGRGTPGQLGAAQASGGAEQRVYTLRADPFLGSDSAILPPEISDGFGDDAGLSLRLIEEAGEGLFREDGSQGYARGSMGTLAVSGTGIAQRSVFLVGTGEVTPINGTVPAPGVAADLPPAPSPDIGLYGSLGEAGSAPATIGGAATLVAFGDGSTIIGDGGENIVVASASRFIEDDDAGYEVAPITVDAWEGSAPPPTGFVHVGDLDTRGVLTTGERLILGQDYETARGGPSGGDFTTTDADTAFTGGYVAALGHSRVDGETTGPYIVHSGGRGVRMSFDESRNEANAVLDFIGGPSTIEFFDGEETRQLGNGVEADPDIREGSLGFGGTQSAMATDGDFLLRNRTGASHDFLIGSTQVNGLPGRASTGGVQQAFRGGLASTGAVGNGGAAVFDPGVNTDPEYLRWGYWSGEFRFADDNGGEAAPREERYHLGSFVTGNRLEDIDLPDSGTASFDGFAVVSVSEGGSEYVDGGGFAMSYDFGERRGTADFTDLAGYDFEVSVNGDSFTVTDGGNSTPDLAIDTASDSYAGTLSSGSIGATGEPGFRPAVDGTVAGSFFTDAAGSDVRATGGRIDFQSSDDGGAGLTASGIFGGDGSVEPDVTGDSGT